LLIIFTKRTLASDEMTRFSFILIALISSTAHAADPPSDGAPFDRTAFSQPAASLSFDERIQFGKGRVIFERLWVPSPAVGSLTRMDGLGPLYNASACSRCHRGNGRGSAPNADRGLKSLVVRVAIPDADGAIVAPDPVYGRQIQTAAIPSHAPEAIVRVTYSERSVTLADGTIVQLRSPSYRLDDLAYGPLHRDAAISPRIAPPMIGLGLLEAIADEDILAGADPADSNRDGISGRAAIFRRANDGAALLGRFGWRAAQPTVLDQAAAAFVDDIGMSTPARLEVFGDCRPAQTECRSAPDGADPYEIDDYSFEMLVHFSRQVGVPERETASDHVFIEAGCADCHRPSFDLPGHPGGPPKTIQPYTDMLLHDMGDGLADGTGREWRTAPLWGLGLTKIVNDEAGFLHDGRAGTILEAVLWHDGEAADARQRVIDMSTEARRALLAFLASL
jgi:CxxC motif-containing protein (DUF1111 family)